MLKPQREGGGKGRAGLGWAPGGFPLLFLLCLGQAVALCQLLVLC